jgi:hypothetical protein
MTDKRYERRSTRYDDDAPRHKRRQQREEITYIFAVNGRPKPPTVHGDRFKLGEIVSTSEGPHKVVEVYWIKETKARVLLRPVPAEEAPKKDKKKQSHGSQGPRKGPGKGQKRPFTPRKPARNRDQGSKGKGK